MLGVKAHVLRYWEQEFPKLNPEKNRSGHRAYSRSDVEFLFQLRSLLHEKRFSIEGARAVVEQGEDAIKAAIEGRPMQVTSEPGAQAAVSEPVQALEAALEAERRARQDAESKAAKAVEDAEKWKLLARKAEARLAALEASVRASIEKMKVLAKKD